MYELSVKDQIMKAKCRLQATHPFFSYILMNMNIEQAIDVKEISTMAVNQFGDLYWNAEFVESMTFDELQAVLCHEAMHMATLSFPRAGKRDHMLWNMATDWAMNWLLKQEGFMLPKGALIPDDYGNIEIPTKKGKNKKIDISKFTAEEVYDHLLQEVETIKQAYGTGKDDGSYKGGFDKHLPGDQGSDGESTGKGKHTSDYKANEEKWKGKTTEAAVHAKSRGHLPSSLERLIGNILEPKVDWRKMLHQFITKDLPVNYTMRTPGRRFHSTGVYMPSVVKENLEIVCAIDVSGSISDEEYNQFIGELLGIAGSFEQIKMRCIWWSTYVDERDDVEVSRGNEEAIRNHKVHNSGGTNLSCIKDYVEKKGITSKVFVYLTDGYVESKPQLTSGKHLFVISRGGDQKILEQLGTCCSLADSEGDYQ